MVHPRNPRQEKKSIPLPDAHTVQSLAPSLFRAATPLLPLTMAERRRRSRSDVADRLCLRWPRAQRCRTLDGATSFRSISCRPAAVALANQRGGA